MLAAQSGFAVVQRWLDARDWKYQRLLEERIQQAQSNVVLFNALDETRLMIHSAFACVACHQQ